MTRQIDKWMENPSNFSFVKSRDERIFVMEKPNEVKKYYDFYSLFFAF